MAGYRGKDLSSLNIGTDLLSNTKADLSINVTISELDARDDSSDSYEEAIAGDQNITISASFNYQKEADGADAQATLIAAAYSLADVPVVWRYEDVIGSPEWTGTAFVTNLTSSNADLGTMSFSLRVKSKPVESVQA